MDSDDSSQHQPSPRSRLAGLKPRKLRVSCDSCSRSKIKCNQNRPICGRCEKLGLICNYSPSRRMGKPPASSRDPRKAGISGRTNTESKLSSDQEEDFSSSLCHSHQSSIDSTSQPQHSSTSSIDSTFQFDPALPFLGMPMPMPSEQNSSFCWQGTMPDWSKCTTNDWNGLATLNDFDHTFNLMDTSMEISRTNNLTQCDMVNFDDEFTSSAAHNVEGQKSCFAGFNYPLFQEPLPIPSYNTPPPTPGFNCTTLASSTLQSLNLDSKTCSSFSTGAQSGTSLDGLGGSSLGSSMDQILIANKSAIKNVATLIACPCSLSQQSSITIALIIDKILAQYQAIVREPRSSSSSSTSSLSSSPESFTRITLGAYRMDAEDEQRIRMQLVSNELRKAVELVKKFSDRYRSQGSRGGDDMYTTLTAFLNRRVKEAAEEIRSLWSRM